MKKNIIKEKSFQFSIKIIKLYKILTSERKEYVMSKQLLRSGTSIGANVSEALAAESRKDFLHKLSIAHKEVYETIYWLELLKETEYICGEKEKEIFSDAKQINRILSSIIKTTKQKINPN